MTASPTIRISGAIVATGTSTSLFCSTHAPTPAPPARTAIEDPNEWTALSRTLVTHRVAQFSCLNH